MSDINDERKETYSFSRLSAWDTCQYGWYQRYVLGKFGDGNAFSAYGTLVHSIMERYAKGDLKIDELAPAFEWEFSSSIGDDDFPPNKFVDLKETYYKQAVQFLSSASKVFDGYKIVSAEESFKVPIDDWMFQGIIDLTLIDEKTGKVCLRDYKSKKPFKTREEMKKYGRQLMLYALHIKQKYGECPQDMAFIHVRSGGQLTSMPFSESACAEAVEWAKSRVNEIRNATSYEHSCEPFFGNYLCNHRTYCEFRTSEVPS